LTLLLTGAALCCSAPAIAQASTAQTSIGPVYEKVPYGPRVSEVANIYEAVTADPTTVMLVHGGGWRTQLSMTHLHKEAVALQDAGFTVFDIDYSQDSTRIPAFPGEPENVEAAVRFAIAHAAQYNANPGNVVMVGGSAGGNLVALAAEHLDAESPGTVRGVVTLSGPMNFESLLSMVGAGEITNANFVASVFRAVGMNEEELEEGEEGAVGNSQAVREGSPVLNVHAAGCPAWLIFNSEHELIPLSQAQEMSGALGAAGCQATVSVVPGRQHAFEYWNKVSPQIMSFIASE